MVKNQSFKARQVDVTAKFSTSLNPSINRDEDIENRDLDIHTRPILYAKTWNTNINNLENSFNCFYPRIPKCLEKQSLFCFVLYCEYLWLYIKYSKPYSILCNCLAKSLLGLIEQRKSLGVVLEHRSLFLLWLSIEVSWRCPWAKISLFLVWLRNL